MSARCTCKVLTFEEDGQFVTDQRDVKESRLFSLDKRLLRTLLFDRTTQRSLRWATDEYSDRGSAYAKDAPMSVDRVIGRNQYVILPRTLKSHEAQEQRVRNKAEVFTPAWVCNAQNNLVDHEWFGRVDVFNTETPSGWVTNPKPVRFSKLKCWRSYVMATRLEVSCGEAPYLTSRYDATSGNYIPVCDRVGFLDRKLRVIGENTSTETAWLDWALKALENVYGYDWQGDNVLLARENLLYAVLEAHDERYKKATIPIEMLLRFAHVISWNIWQMDGLKCVVPESCHVEVDTNVLPGMPPQQRVCSGCSSGNVHAHNGVYCRIMDWKTKKSQRFVDLLGTGRN